MKSTAVIIVGLNYWYDLTFPAIRSFLMGSGPVRVICVDNGSNPPYPPTLGRVIMVRNEETGYAGGVNLGIEADLYAEWYLIVSNDVICHANLMPIIDNLSEDTVYCAAFQKGQKWIDGWLYLISKKAWRDIGPFDAAIPATAGEDIDYSIRTEKAGYKLEIVNLPIEHRATQSRFAVPHYRDIRLKNFAYVEKKHGVKIDVIR